MRYETKQEYQNNFEDNPYDKTIRIKSAKLKFLKENRQKKSAAAFLDEILEEYTKPNLFKRRKHDR